MKMKHLLLLSLVLLTACQSKPKKIHLGEDHCSFCKMTIVDARFACQRITEKGKTYFYDDIKCLRNDKKEGTAYLALYTDPERFVVLDNARLVSHDSLNSPMGGNTAVYEK